MSIDGIMLAAISEELSKEIIGGRIDKIYQPENYSLTMLIRQGNHNIKLLLSANPQYPRVHLTKQDFENPVKAPDFCMLLRKYLIRGTIISIEQPNFERILNLQIQLHGHHYHLLIEIMGRHSNITLVNDEGIVLDAIKRVTLQISRERQLYPGIKYKYPPVQDKLNPLSTTKEDFFEKIPEDAALASFRAVMYNFRGIGPDMSREIIFRAGFDPSHSYQQLSTAEKEKVWEYFNNIFTKVSNKNFQLTIGLGNDQQIVYSSAFPLLHKEKKGDVEQTLAFAKTGELLDYFYSQNIKINLIDQEKNGLLTKVQTYLSKNKKQQKEYKGQLQDAHDAGKYKKIGELLTANIYQLKNRANEVTVIDYFDPEQNLITITLDPKLTPAENAQRYFKRYNKVKKSIKHLKKQLGRLRHELRYLEQVCLNIEQAENKKELKEIREELKDEGYIKDKKKSKPNKKREKPLPPLQFKSSQGFAILVGRNNRQNDHLTKELANKNDTWLHIKDLAGSHVIIRNHTREDIPNETLEEAAIIAAYYSKARQSENVAIDFTEVKNVRKPKGAKPGLVFYENYQTVYVNPDQELVNKLSQS